MDTAHTDIYANIRKNGPSTFCADGTPVPFFLPLVLDVDCRDDDDDDVDGDVLTERNSGSELNGSDEEAVMIHWSFDLSLGAYEASTCLTTVVVRTAVHYDILSVFVGWFVGGLSYWG